MYYSKNFKKLIFEAGIKSAKKAETVLVNFCYMVLNISVRNIHMVEPLTNSLYYMPSVIKTISCC